MAYVITVPDGTSREDAQLIHDDIKRAIREGGVITVWGGVKVEKVDDSYDNPLVICEFCGQWAAVYTRCSTCNAPVKPLHMRG